MPDLDTRLARLGRSSGASLFAGAVTPELRTRVERAVAAGSAWEGGGVAAPVARPRGWRPPRALAVAASVATVVAVVAVTSWPGGGPTAVASLTVQPSGAPPVSIADPHALAGAGVVALAGGDAIELPVEIDALGSLAYRWSPDGTRLAFGNRGDLFVYDTRTGETANVTVTPRRWELLPSWSPDGSLLAFVSRQLLPGEGAPPESPDALDWVLVGVAGGSPTVARADGGGYRVLDDAVVTTAPAWSPDGATIAYAVDGVVTGDDPATASARADGELRLADVEGRRIRALAPGAGRGAGFVGAPSWSPDGSELSFFFSASDRTPSRAEVLSGAPPLTRQGYATLDLRTGVVAELHAFEAPFVPRPPAAWSADGSLLAVALRQEGAIDAVSELLVVRRDGGVERVQGLFAHVVWEPGANRLAARDDLEPGAVLLVTVTRSGLSVERLRFDGDVAGLAWRPAEGS